MAIFSMDTHQLIPSLTFFFIIFHYYFSAFPKYGVGHPFMFTTFTFLLLLFFLFPKLIHNFYFWTPLVGYYWIFLIDSWLICQNHDILWGYWLLVILTNCLVPQERKTKFLSLNASLLIAFVFLFSIIHKAISPDFLSGNILYYQLLFSTRFYFLDAIFPFNYLDILESNLIKLLNLQENFVPFNFKFIPPQIYSLAQFLSWTVYGLELLISILFFFPKHLKLIRYRDFFLLVFIFSIYFILQLNGFIFLMVLLGMSQTSSKDILARSLYIFSTVFYITLIT